MGEEKTVLFDIDRLHSAYIIEAHDAFDKLSYVKSLIKSIFCLEFERDRDNPRYAGGKLSPERIEKLVDDETHLDLIHVQATVSKTSRTNKKSVKTEDIENFISEIVKSPVQSNRRIGIIENADSMTVQSANSLLKTLEEPAEGAVIFLLSENSLTLPETIRSRCIIIRPPAGLRKLNPEYASLAEEIMKLLENENRFFFEYVKIADEVRLDREKAFGLVDALEEMFAARMRTCNSAEIEGFAKAIKECEACKKNIRANAKIDFAIKKLLLSLGGVNEKSSRR